MVLEYGALLAEGVECTFLEMEDVGGWEENCGKRCLTCFRKVGLGCVEGLVTCRLIVIGRWMTSVSCIIL